MHVYMLQYRANIAIFFFCWNSHPQLVIKVFYGFLPYLQEIGLKGKKSISISPGPCKCRLTTAYNCPKYIRNNIVKIGQTILNFITKYL
jgi:hypothetical protein